MSERSIGQQESQILDTMTTIDQLECLAFNASKVKIDRNEKHKTKMLSFFFFEDFRLAHENSIDVFDVVGEIEEIPNEIRSDQRTLISIQFETTFA